jgi:hypothetical protein
MARITISVLITAIMMSFAWGETIINGGSVSGTWTPAGSPYVILSNVVVMTDSTLTMLPGTEVHLQSAAMMYIYGSLSAVGTSQDSIIISAHSASPYHRMRFIHSDSGNYLAYCSLRHVDIYLGQYSTNPSSAVVEHCLIT